MFYEIIGLYTFPIVLHVVGTIFRQDNALNLISKQESFELLTNEGVTSGLYGLASVSKDWHAKRHTKSIMGMG